MHLITVLFKSFKPPFFSLIWGLLTPAAFTPKGEIYFLPLFDLLLSVRTCKAVGEEEIKRKRALLLH